MVAYPEKELLGTARKVLTGELNREQLATLPRNVMVYAGVAVMLASRYKLSDDDQVLGPISTILEELLYNGTEHHQGYLNNQHRGHHSSSFQAAASKLGLYESSSYEGSRRLLLTPSPALRELVEEARGSAAVQAFLDDMRTSQTYQSDHPLRNQGRIERSVTVDAAEAVIRNFADNYGVEGLKILGELLAVHINLRS